MLLYVHIWFFFHLHNIRQEVGRIDILYTHTCNVGSNKVRIKLSQTGKTAGVLAVVPWTVWVSPSAHTYYLVHVGAVGCNKCKKVKQGWNINQRVW